MFDDFYRRICKIGLLVKGQGSLSHLFWPYTKVLSNDARPKKSEPVDKNLYWTESYVQGLLKCFYILLLA
ncbi:hypothetical protein ISN44_As07g011080 [Arabidopsis suecica]|uniref:Uncharacterized protein n=1 Tax=Arabidopsis suecica TaxID=45249 RepID=A0A8T2BSV5_ARASU|nr:hypothetical protein ISN44_As07g011080 [Arabidopsis suecica]